MIIKAAKEFPRLPGGIYAGYDISMKYKFIQKHEFMCNMNSYPELTSFQRIQLQNWFLTNKRNSIAYIDTNDEVNIPYRINCPDDILYFNLHVLEAIEGAVARVVPSPKVISFKHNPNGETVHSDHIGDIYFTKESLKAGVIAHESVHCATTFLRARGELFPLDAEDIDHIEEDLAYAVGHFAKEISNLYWKINEA